MKDINPYEELYQISSRNSDQNIYNRLKFPIPLDPNQFYQDVGLILHPDRKLPDGTPELVKKLTAYQTKVWQDGHRYKYRLTIKSQKIGLTTSSLMEDFQYAVLPRSNPLSCSGYEILIIAQSDTKAIDHLGYLRQWILNSNKYKDFLILKPESVEQNEESSKHVLYIRNPDDPKRPTKIIGVSIESEASIWSWKNVKFIHMSDPAAANILDDSGAFAAAFSRLANTNGRIHIETPPRGQRGKVWEIYQRSKIGSEQKTNESVFKINEIPSREAVEAGVITQEYLEKQKIEMGISYGQYFECDFMNSSNTYYTSDLFEFDDTLTMG